MEGSTFDFNRAEADEQDAEAVAVRADLPAAIDSAPSSPPAAAFDYGTLPDDVAEQARQAVARVRTSVKVHIIRTGRELQRVRDLMPHGTFLAWVSAELGLSPNTARNYMRVARELGDKSATVAHLTPGTLYALTAPSTPKALRQAMVARIEAGDGLDDAAVRRVVMAAKPPKAQPLRISSGAEAESPAETETLVEEAAPVLEPPAPQAPSAAISQSQEAAARAAISLVNEHLDAKFAEFADHVAAAGDAFAPALAEAALRRRRLNGHWSDFNDSRPWRE